MIDIRILSKICLKEGLSLKYLGFNSATNNVRKPEQTISENEMIHIPNIHKESKTILDYIQRVANTESKAYKSMSEMGPYDIINLDLCNSVAQMASGRNTGNYRYFDAIYRILNYQTKTRIQPWLLFLTTRGEKPHVDPIDLEKLWSCIYNNIRENNGFKEKLETLIGHKMGHCESVEDVDLDFFKFVQLFGIGVGKWFIKTMMSAEPKCSVQMLNSYCYRVNHGKPNLISFAFLLRPVIQLPINIANLAERIPEEPTATIDIQELECTMVDTISEITDLDLLLLEEPDIRMQMICETKELLRQARYDISIYDEWEQENRSRIT